MESNSADSAGGSSSEALREQAECDQRALMDYGFWQNDSLRIQYLKVMG